MAQVSVEHHIYLNTANGNGAFNPYRQMVFIVRYPNGHFFAAFKNGPFQQKWFEFYAPKFTVPGFNSFFAKIADIHVKYLVVQKKGQME